MYYGANAILWKLLLRRATKCFLVRALSSDDQFDAKVPKIYVIFVILPSAVITWCNHVL